MKSILAAAVLLVSLNSFALTEDEVMWINTQTKIEAAEILKLKADISGRVEKLNKIQEQYAFVEDSQGEIRAIGVTASEIQEDLRDAGDDLEKLRALDLKSAAQVPSK